jgi:hypothetical protein
MLDSAFLLSRAVVHRAHQKMHGRAGLQFQCGRQVFQSQLVVPDFRQQRSE